MLWHTSCGRPRKYLECSNESVKTVSWRENNICNHFLTFLGTMDTGFEMRGRLMLRDIDG